MDRRVWPALRGTCYYPIDLLTKPGAVTVTRWTRAGRETASVAVEAYEYPTQQVDIGDIPQAAPTPEEEKRAVHEEAVTARVFSRRDGPAEFTLPLEAPARPLPEGRDFGVNRIFNDTPAGQQHMGADYTIALGTPVHAAADGRVALAEDQFFAGNAVYIDHGDGLVTMYFHLSKIDVKPGQRVRKGQTIGLVGSTGRSTGAHLFFGARWHDARIDPNLLLAEPAKMSSIDPARKVTAAGN
jgi:murein DD-endopeptidase MepM/ murein hydrolase activator NlpD